MERLDKILANTGRWSRKEARELVRVGRVAVDGVTAQAADGKYLSRLLAWLRCSEM